MRSAWSISTALILGFASTALAQAPAINLSVPAEPAIDDAALAPPPPAPRVLHSWDEALTLVRNQSPDYQATFDNVLRAEAQTRVALAGLLPNAAAQITFTHQFVTMNTAIDGPAIIYPQQDVWGVGATLTWPIGDPRAWYARGTAQQGVEAAREDLNDKRRMIAQAIVTSMLGTLAAERVAELNRIGLRGTLERLSLTQTRSRLGSGTPLDVERAEQDVATSRAQLITGDEALRQAREALGLALGSKEPIAAPGDLNLADFEKAVLDSCQAGVDLERRPDVEAARTRVAIAERAVTNNWLGYAPSFLIESQLLWDSQVLYGPNTNWDLAAVLNIPIWDGGARYGQMRDARAQVDQSRQALAAARLNALVNIAQTARSVSVARASLEVAQQQRELALKIDQRTREGYLHGVGTSLDLVTSAQALRLAEINLALLQFQASQARVLAVLANAECVY